MFVLDYIKQNKWQNPLFRRRYTHIVTQWCRLIPKSKMMDILRLLVQSLGEETDSVLIYEHSRCIHEIIKEISHWIKKSESPSGKHSQAFYAGNSLLNNGSSISEEEDQINLSKQIESQIDYSQLFSVVA